MLIAVKLVGTFRNGFIACFAAAASCAGVDLLLTEAEAVAPTPIAIANARAAEIVPSLSFLFIIVLFPPRGRL